MGSFIVELSSPPVELSLLRIEILAGWACGLAFERLVHAFVLAVLFGVGGLGKLGSDAELDPPHRKTREATESDRRERNTVVGSNRVG